MANQRAYPRYVTDTLMERQKILNQVCDWIFQLETSLAAVKVDLAGDNLFTGTIVTAPLTGGGTTGTMVFVGGRLVSQVAAT